jgi:hypothetical protein
MTFEKAIEEFEARFYLWARQVRIPINSDTHSKNNRTVFGGYSDSCRSEAKLWVPFKRGVRIRASFGCSRAPFFGAEREFAYINVLPVGYEQAG